MSLEFLGAALAAWSSPLPRGGGLNARSGQSKITSAKETARKILEDAEKQADTLKREKLLEVKDEWYEKKKEFDNDIQGKRNKLSAQEKALETREENIDRKVELLGKKEREQAQLRSDRSRSGHGSWTAGRPNSTAWWRKRTSASNEPPGSPAKRPSAC